MDTTLLNAAMQLAMEWGADFMKPTQERLRKQSPTLADKELDDYNTAAQAAMKFGHDYVSKHPGCTGQALAAALRKTFPWVSDENASRVYSQGCYYAWKDGLM